MKTSSNLISDAYQRNEENKIKTKKILLQRKEPHYMVSNDSEYLITFLDERTSFDG